MGTIFSLEYPEFSLKPYLQRLKSGRFLLISGEKAPHYANILLPTVTRQVIEMRCPNKMFWPPVGIIDPPLHPYLSSMGVGFQLLIGSYYQQSVSAIEGRHLVAAMTLLVLSKVATLCSRPSVWGIFSFPCILGST